MGYAYVKDDGSVASVNLRGCNKDFSLTDIVDFDDNSSKRFYYLVVDNTTLNMDTPEVYLNIHLETYDESQNEWAFEQINLPYQFTDADDNFYYSFTYKMVKLMKFEHNAMLSPNEPDSFTTNSPRYSIESNRSVWGTCP